MENLSTLLSIALIWGIAAATPGPNFFVAVRTAAAHSRRLGLAVVAGIVSGTFVWGLAGFFGISTLFALAPWLYAVLKLLGALYLTYLGVRLILASFRPAAQNASAALAPQPKGWQGWRLGLMTNLANPKTAAFVTSLFATTMPAEPSLQMGLAAAGVMVGVSLLWYGAVVFVFATPVMTRSYTRMTAVIDRIAGGIFILFGVKLALDR